MATKLAAGHLAFNDWRDRIRESKLGFDLRLRHRLLSYYGARYRTWFERHLLLTPQFITVLEKVAVPVPVGSWRRSARTARRLREGQAVGAESI